MIKHALLYIWLTPVSPQAVPVAYFETLAGCVASLPVAEAQYRRVGWGDPTGVCVGFNFAPIESPRPRARPERRP